MEQLMKSHEKISRQYADAYIEAYGPNMDRAPQHIHSLTKVMRMKALRDASITKVITARQQLVTD